MNRSGRADLPDDGLQFRIAQAPQFGGQPIHFVLLILHGIGLASQLACYHCQIPVQPRLVIEWGDPDMLNQVGRDRRFQRIALGDHLGDSRAEESRYETCFLLAICRDKERFAVRNHHLELLFAQE